jgi:hypothetical protein
MIGYDLEWLGRYDEALEHFKESLSIMQQIGTNRPFRAQYFQKKLIFPVSVGLNDTGDASGEGSAHWNVARMYKKAHAMEDAMEAAMLAHSSFSACFGAKHPKTQNVKGAIESILQQHDLPFPLMKAALTLIGHM